MCNRNGNSRLMSGDNKLILNLTGVPLCLWENTVCSFKYFEQCIIHSLITSLAGSRVSVRCPLGYLFYLYIYTKRNYKIAC